jgi:methylase of polypeptide subunit release factors
MPELTDAHRAPLDPPLPRLPRLARHFGRAWRFANELLLARRYRDFRLERVHGVPLLVTPGVFNPQLLRSGAYFAGALGGLLGEAGRVLDMGTGSGVGALFAARHATHVTAVDISVAAVRCARINAALNGLEDRIDVRHGDLFAALAGERFDVVLFNPPFVRGAPRSEADRAWRSLDVPERFAAGLRAHLAPGGRALVLLSSFGDASMFLAAFRREALCVRRIAGRRFVNEEFVIYQLTDATLA